MSNDIKYLSASATERGSVHWAGVVTMSHGGHVWRASCPHNHRKMDRAKACAEALLRDLEDILEGDEGASVKVRAEGYVWCQTHGGIHHDSTDPFDYGKPECEVEDHRLVYWAPRVGDEEHKGQ